MIFMTREVVRVSAENKAEAILALEMMLDIVKREYKVSDRVERSCFADMYTDRKKITEEES